MYEEEVKRGGAWLDQVDPGWYKKINIDQLNLDDYGRCTLGQTLGQNVSMNLCSDGAFSWSHGFALNEPDTLRIKTRFGRFHRIENTNKKGLYRVLTAQWIYEILRRRTADRLADSATQAAKEKQASGA